MLEVYTDGATDAHGWSGIGIVLKQGKEIEEYSFPIGKHSSNHVAEFEAIVRALTICSEQYVGEILSFRLDAQVVVDAVEKNFTRNKAFKPYVKEIQDLSGNFPHLFIKWIPQKDNVHADRLAKRAIYLNEK